MSLTSVEAIHGMMPLGELNVSPLQWGVVIGVSLVAAAFDLATRRIPNLLTGVAFLAGIGWAIYSGGPMAGLYALAVAVLLAAPYVFLFVFAGGGAGDAKLMAAIGAWLGLWAGLVTLVAVLLSGVVIALAFAVRAGRLRKVVENVGGVVRRWLAILPLGTSRRTLSMAGAALTPTSEMQAMPYGLAILAGVCIAALGIHLWGR